MANEITAQHAKALDLHNRIVVSAQLVQTNLWDMCNGLKEMRDGKLYKELGYQNFEEYCETEHGFSRSNAHKYISIIENIDPENVSPVKHLGMRKLYLLSTLTQSDQEKITAENNVGEMTVKELEREIKYLKDKNNEMDRQLDEQGGLLAEMRVKTADAKREKDDALHEVDRLNRRIGELESRPIEATVTETTDEVRQLKETIKNIEISTEQQMKQMEEEHVADIRELHEKNRAETQKQLDAQKAEYEEKLREAAVPAQKDDKEEFKGYFSAAYYSFSRMIDFAKESENKEFFRSKIGNMVNAFRELAEKM
jgi:chromosome segregation ATPase